MTPIERHRAGHEHLVAAKPRLAILIVRRAEQRVRSPAFQRVVEAMPHMDAMVAAIGDKELALRDQRLGGQIELQMIAFIDWLSVEATLRQKTTGANLKG